MYLNSPTTIHQRIRFFDAISLAATGIGGRGGGGGKQLQVPTTYTYDNIKHSFITIYLFFFYFFFTQHNDCSSVRRLSSAVTGSRQKKNEPSETCGVRYYLYIIIIIILAGLTRGASVFERTLQCV